MARRIYRRDSRGRFATGGGARGSGVAEGKARRRGGEALKATAGAVMAKAESKGRTNRRNIRAASEATNLGILNKATGRYRKASPKAKAVATARGEKAKASQAAVAKEYRVGLQAAKRRGRNVTELGMRRRYIKPN